MAFLVPLRMTITRVGEGYPWWRLRWNRLGKQELSVHARSEILRARGRRELEREGEDLDGEIADFLTSKAKRRVTVSGRSGPCR
jgi:hypothetical protein